MTGVTGICRLVFFLTHKNSVLLSLLVFCGLTQDLYALSYLKVDIGSIENTAVVARQFSMTVNDLHEKTSRSQLSIEQFIPLDQEQYGFNRFLVECDVLAINRPVVQCDDAAVTLNSKSIRAEKAGLAFAYQPASGQADITLSGLRLYSGSLSANIQLLPSLKRTVLKLDKVRLNSANLAELAAGLAGGFEFESLLSGNIQIDMQENRLSSEYKLHFNDMAFSNPEGDFLAENLAFDISANQQHGPDVHQLNKFKLELTDGEILAPYFYSDFSQRPLSVELSNAIIRKANQWNIQKIIFSDNYLQATANDVSGDNKQIVNGLFKLNETELADVYSFYFLPVISKELAQLKANGKVSIRLSLSDGNIGDYQFKLSGINIEHAPNAGDSKFTFKNLQGIVDSSLIGPASTSGSYLGFEQARLFETVSFGQTLIPLKTSSQSIAITEMTSLPIFDGSLLIEKFALDYSASTPTVEFEGLLTPVSLSLITEALGWPKMQGKISGIIPAVSYRKRNAEIDGTLLVKVFDGSILLKDLQVSHLLSSWPVLKADVEFIGIDLEQLTQTFEFGRITGNIDGQISQLVLENWEPTQFDAKFLTSKNPGRKRISQKAVDNISNLGGAGAAGALSRTFMRFFEDFGYDQLGFSCRLRQGVCEMDGVAEANQGYYLVKGGGIPRIDVIGHNRQTDWNILVDRLVNISEAGTPSIQ